jgi:hypothetical protein
MLFLVYLKCSGAVEEEEDEEEREIRICISAGRLTCADLNSCDESRFFTFQKCTRLVAGKSSWLGTWHFTVFITWGYTLFGTRMATRQALGWELGEQHNTGYN